MPKRTVVASDIAGQLHKLNVSDLRWRPSAYGIVVKDGNILLSPQNSGYDLPGGGVELGEMPEEAVIREVFEETGIVVKNPRIIDSASNFFLLPNSGKGREVQSILLYYLCDYVSGKLSDANFTEDDKQYTGFPQWISVARVNDIELGSSYDWRPLVEKVT